MSIWAPLIALQNEYSLLERSVEDDLAPIAMELEMGLTPWASLKLGVLSGKFTTENKNKPGCEPKEWQSAHLNEKAYRVTCLRINRSCRSWCCRLERWAKPGRQQMLRRMRLVPQTYYSKRQSNFVRRFFQHHRILPLGRRLELIERN